MLSRHESDEIRYLEREAWEVEGAAWEGRDSDPQGWLPTDELLRIRLVDTVGLRSP